MRLLAAAERLARAAGLQRVHIGFTPHPDQLIRGATPRAWGAAHGLQVHPVAEATAGGAPIRSTRIRDAIAGGDLTGAARLLGRPYALVGALQGDQVRLQPNMAAVPPPGEYRARVGVAGRPEGRLPLVGRLTTVRVDADGLTITLLRPEAADQRFDGGPIRVALLGGSL